MAAGYDDTQALAQHGVDVRAFAVCDGVLHEMPVAQWLRDISKTGTCKHPALQTKGWWRRPERVLYAPPVRFDEATELPSAS